MNSEKPILWIDASNCRDGGGVTHLLQILPHIEKFWSPHPVTIFAAQEQRILLNRIVKSAQLPLVPVLDDKKWKRLIWQRFHLPLLAKKTCSEGIFFAPGGLVAGKFPPGWISITMSRNMLPFDQKEALRYRNVRELMRLGLLRLGQMASFKRTDGIVFLSDYAQNAIVKIDASIQERSTLIPHGIGDVFRCYPRIDKISLLPRKLLYVSTIDVYKHQWQVVEALAILRQRGLNLSLDLVGRSYGPARKRLDVAIKKFNLASQVNIIGKIAFDQLPQLYHNTDIFVFASSCENLPNILLEAMASGLPIACSDRGPMPEVARDGATYFDPENPNAIANAIEKLVLDPDLRYRFAMRAFELASAYTWDKCGFETARFLYQTWKQKYAKA